jgi:pSer/pThr/pTyr-binding forkhead associated (FHA) protein
VGSEKLIEGVEVVIRKPGKPDRVVRLTEGTSTIGRAEDNDVVLSDVGVSRRHSQIRLTQTDVEVEDLGSGNGTYYHGYRVKLQVLQDGDEVVIDPFVLQFRIHGDVLPASGQPGGQSATPARLEVVTGHGMAGSSYPITSAGLTIGRSEDRDVVLPDPAASRHHVSIYVDNTQYSMKDMGSANGVFVNAVRVRECLLADGDMIRIGNTELRFRIYDKDAGDTTTQVMPGEEVWSQVDTTGSVVKTGGGVGRWIVFALSILLLLGGVGLVTIVAIVLAVLHQQGALGSNEALPARPPAFVLQLPAGLPSTSVDKLYDEGVASLRKGEAKPALQNFYRVLSAQPDNQSARKLAVAAGESLLFVTLQEEFKARGAVSVQLDVKRDELLASYARGGSARRRARADLVTSYAHDAKVQEVLKLPLTEAQTKHATLLVEGSANLDANQAHEAASAFQVVLAESETPEVRRDALDGWTASRKALALTTLSEWQLAAMQLALEEPGAPAALDDLAKADPSDPTVDLYRSRLK